MKSFFQNKSKEFLSYLKDIRHYSPLTIKTYRQNLTQAIKFVSIEMDDDLYVINLIPYRNKLVSLNRKTIYKKVAIFRSFIKYLKREDINIKLIGDESIKIPHTLPKPVSNEVIDEVLKRCDFFEKLVVLLFYGLGLRISELVNLKLEDITQSWVSVKGKGGKIRQVPVLDELSILIDEYIKRSDLKTYLFEKDGKVMSENQLRYLISKVFKRVGLKVSPHRLRHSFASSLLNSGARINDVSELLGHSSLATTQIYTKLSASSKMRSYNNAHPMCRSRDESV